MKTRRWHLYPNAYESPKGWLVRQWRTFCNFLFAAFHPRLVPPWTLRKYLKVMGVYHRCMHGWRSNHRLIRNSMRKGQGSDVSAFGMQAWQTKTADPNFDPNWEVKISIDPAHDEKAPVTEANGEDDRADSDPPKRR